MSKISQSPIDAVITWVDGSDPAHLAKRKAAARAHGRPLHANAANPHRWGSADELGYCLRSIQNHAPWLRRIWIVTDAQRPDASSIPPELAAQITIVDHRTIFAGHDGCLPCFNSLAIECLLWRIPGLSDRFLYFNDDVFLTAALTPDDVFHGAAPVLRGKWVDYSALAEDPSARADPALFNHFTQITAAQMLGYTPARLWDSAHVVHPLNRQVLEHLFHRYGPAYGANIAHPFRDISQFQPMALHNHACLRSGQFGTVARKDYLHVHSGATQDFSLPDVRRYLTRATLPDMRFLCVNDLPALRAALPDANHLIEQAIAA